MPVMSKKEERVWAALIEDRSRSVETVADITDTPVEFVKALINRIGSPDWRQPATVQFDLPDDNPKTVLGEQKPKISSTPTVAIREMGKVFELGAKKYGKFNWRKHKVSSSVYYDAAWRHLSAWYEGEDNDPESGISHLAHVMACAAILLDAGTPRYDFSAILNDDRE